MVTPGFHPIKGGTETIVRNLSMELNRIGVHTDVMTFNMDQKYAPKWRGKIEKIEGITVFKIPALNWLPIEHSPRITLGVNLIPGRFTNLLKEYNIIHFHELDFSFPLFSFFVRKPKIFHLHGIDVNFLKRYHLSRVILKHVADYYISISRQIERNLLELGISRDRILYLPNAVNGELFRPHGEKEDNLILFVGRISFEKGLHVLLDSLRDLKKSVSLVIIGPATSLNYYQDILKRIEKENQRGKHRITYLGALDQPEVAKWCQKASILILPSFSEGFPVVILEALSCETPVIATPVGGIPEVVKNRENGILVPQNDPFKLAETIQFLLENEDMRIKFGHEGRELVVKEFSLKTVVSKLTRIYEQMLNSFNS
jgi:glycosyltransferase involved in cell wall biosynthesis